MGCDGGTIPKRDELVRVKKKPEQKDKKSELSFRWEYCNASQEPLKKPIVACTLGRLYNKDVIIQNLLDKSIPESMSHVKGLRDIKDLNLVLNPTYKDEAEKGDNHIDKQTSPYICPISGLEMNGKFKFCFFWTCGCVVSERGLKQFSEKNCPTCQKPYTDSDIVIMNAADEDIQLNLNRRKERQSTKKANKKTKNEVKLEPEEELVDAHAVASSEDANSIKLFNDSNKVSNSVPCKEARKEKAESSTSSKPDNKRPLDELYDPSYKKVKQSYSVSKDPKATDVYKSLFTTSSAAKNHSHAHWVTYNPFYN